MNLQATNSRLLEEIKTLASLLKMKILVESGNKEIYSKLINSIENLIKLEEKVDSHTSHYSDLESEVLVLRKTVEKFSELSESVQLITTKNKQQISQLASENALLSQEINELKSVNNNLLLTISDLKKEISDLKQKSDKDRTLFAQEQHLRRVQEQKLLQTLDLLSRLKKQKNFSEEEIKAEYESLKGSMEKLQEKVEKIQELEELLHLKDEELQSLKRKNKSLEREISLLQDENAY